MIGGGVTGLAAARFLRQKDLAVTLVSRGFPFGGRLRPDVVEGPAGGRLTFDPVPVDVRLPRAASPAAPLDFPGRSLAADLFAAEQLHHVPVRALSSGPAREDAPLVAPRGGARAVINALLPTGPDDLLTVLARAEVTRIEPDGRGWRAFVTDELGTRAVRADAVLLTQPVDAALALLDVSAVPPPDAVRDELSRVRYAPGLGVQVAFRTPDGRPLGGVLRFDDSPLALLFDNAHTGAAAAAGTVTALAEPGWAAEHWDRPDEEIARALLPLVAPWGGEPVWHRVRRWDRCRPTARLRMPFTEAGDVPPVVLAGDAFAGYVSNPLDAAYTSAAHAATHLARVLGREARLAGRAPRSAPRRVQVEVAVSSAAEAETAVACGADRLLVCAAPEIGGLTPSPVLVRMVRRAAVRRGRRLPVTALVRPWPGSPEYTDGEFEQVRREAAQLLRAGASGIAVAAVTGADGEVRVDAERCRVLADLAHARNREVTFGREFDALTDRAVGLQDLIALGFDRVYTSGGRRWVGDGTSELAAAVAYAGWDIEVVPAGVGAGVVGYVAAETGCRQVLVEASESAPGTWKPSTRAHRSTLETGLLIQAVSHSAVPDAEEVSALAGA